MTPTSSQPDGAPGPVPPGPAFQQAWGAWLRMLREARGLTQRDLEIRAGVGRHTVGPAERAERAVRIDVIPLLADALDVSMADLFDFSLTTGPTTDDLARVLGRPRPPT